MSDSLAHWSGGVTIAEHDPSRLEGGGRVFRSARFGLKAPSKPLILSPRELTDEQLAEIAAVRARLDPRPLDV